MTLFESTIHDEFKFLFDVHGFEFIQEECLTDEYPNRGVVVIQNKDIRFRFVKDRADFFLDVALKEAPDEWIDIYNVLPKLKKQNLINSNTKPVHSLSRFKRILKGNEDLIAYIPNAIRNK
jgi:hypothetical protein